ncbi:DENN domain-containing protein 2A [Chiloscyllium plagiosum]|uniref:DENN domain-containing protein 2A n=1 Tax=Chiloscyllium plagiosum TaxID=36176 RepID=UPI001CB8240B|nr:DENN domain-containing protein 2A [Chiloscyllium plagiosum]XP_043565317.1 DENN domain-containing protein 2A [Chiloscyllium plagiosum]XP_043565318.1 DENN domain-containing protein 2A [Chiloscyllium plagiosum]XP_043565320.1 DENN domain-containing protein 2A [Chiloscyllium plagiosum]XP_043565321.1 DENN domain-containing protein 2A [Chiloscyllium plagiosum]XP_043565322.1 DENN domain-containing protein 2A [Chiloscyllium plagiosum]
MPFTNAMTANKTTVLSWTTTACNSKSTEQVRTAGKNFVFFVEEPSKFETENIGNLHRSSTKKSSTKVLIGTQAVDSTEVKCPLKQVNNCLSKSSSAGSEQKMLNPKLGTGNPSLDINSVKENELSMQKPLKNTSNERYPPSKMSIIIRNPSIKQKISEWEGKKELVFSADKEKLESKEAKALDKLELVKGVEGNVIKKTECKHSKVWNLDSKDAGKENEYKVDDGKARSLETESRLSGCRQNEMIKSDLTQQIGRKVKEVTCTKLATTQPLKRDRTTVLSHIKKLEEKAKEDSASSQLKLPGDYYTPQRLQEALAAQGPTTSKEKKDGSCSSELKRKHIQSNSDSEASELSFGTVDKVKVSWASCKIRNVENIYSEPGTLEQELSVNPVPKPRRTFEYGTEKVAGLHSLRKSTRQLPDLPTIPPPLPLSPPPTISTGALNGKPKINSKDIRRKSFEFEDVKDFQKLKSPNFCRNGQVDWYAQSKLALNYTASEENIYEDILDVPKENPYEDIELSDRHLLGKQCVQVHPSSAGSTPKPGSPSEIRPETPTKLPVKTPSLFRHSSDRRSFKLLDLRKMNKDGISSPPKASPPSTPSSPDDSLSLAGDSQVLKRRKKIPKVVLKINAIYEARRGRKKVKRITQSSETSTGRVTDENSETDSETEEKLKAHSQRLVLVKSMLKQKGRYRTLERDLIEFQEWQLFEFFVVVALHMKKGSSLYIPEVTQQFPLKLDKPFKFMRETEDQLKVIPQFCFPDAKDWVPVSEFASETFSFVLTGEDGSRRFGYCRRLLPTGKGKRLPEVYCIVSRLGCFNLFSKILDEVEKRRVISPALVQPFMRSVMEAPFPAPGRTITVRNFLPGSGNEVIQLCRPQDSRLEHVDFECLFVSLTVRQLTKVFASLLLERRVIFTADKLSTLSKCCHAVMALLYPFAWQHTYIPVLPPSMIDIACSPTPFLIGLLSSSLPKLRDLPLEEVLVVNLGTNKFLRQVDDEDSILPRKLQVALEHVLEMRTELASQEEEDSSLDNPGCLNSVVSETFVRFFVEIVGHYSLYMTSNEKDERLFLWEAFRKSITSKSVRRFLEVFMETQMFGGFIQDRELRKLGVKGLFEVRAQDYLESLPGSEQRGMNRFLRGLGSKMKFLHKK